MKYRDPRDHDQEQARDMRLVFEYVKQGLITTMAARPLMMEIVTRPIRREAMEGTLVEQLMNSCKHFTGIGDKACRAGVKYAAVRDRPNRTISCLKMTGSLMSHNDLCEQQVFPTMEEAEAIVGKMRERDKKIDAMLCPDCDGLLVEHVRRDGRHKGHGKITCPACRTTVVTI